MGLADKKRNLIELEAMQHEQNLLKYRDEKKKLKKEILMYMRENGYAASVEKYGNSARFLRGGKLR